MRVTDFYELQLIILAIVCCVGLFVDRQLSRASKAKETADDRLENGRQGSAAAAAALSRKYLLVYAIVMGEFARLLCVPGGLLILCLGADWLQGPYVYSLYREQYGFPERMVAVFFVTGFLSAGLAAPLIGVWADQQYVVIFKFVYFQL